MCLTISLLIPVKIVNIIKKMSLLDTLKKYGFIQSDFEYDVNVPGAKASSDDKENSSDKSDSQKPS